MAVDQELDLFINFNKNHCGFYGRSSVVACYHLQAFI